MNNTFSVLWFRLYVRKLASANATKARVCRSTRSTHDYEQAAAARYQQEAKDIQARGPRAVAPLAASSGTVGNVRSSPARGVTRVYSDWSDSHKWRARCVSADCRIFGIARFRQPCFPGMNFATPVREMMNQMIVEKADRAITSSPICVNKLSNIRIRLQEIGK
ncbi:hypothetical protein J6590_051369 [Homalodisca vitripennis]|nr:hypothetical protein J6590_051369 [Homalodisca vitripennis]